MVDFAKHMAALPAGPKPAEPAVEIIVGNDPLPEFLDDPFDGMAEVVATSPPFELNEEQANAVEQIKAFLADPSRTMFGLYGYAGTGKTTVIQRVFDRSMRLRVAMSAPTHKAVGVLSGMAEVQGLGHFKFATIHHLCAVKPIKRRGKSKFMPKPGAHQPIKDYNVIVIDECSMIGKEMWGWIHDAVSDPFKGRSIKTIFMGDPAQLPPIGEADSLSFSLPNVTLTRIMRNRGAIQNAATNVRISIESKRTPPLARDETDEHGTIENLEPREWLERLVQAAEEHGSDVKALAYTNEAVDRINAWVRKRKYGKHAPPFVEGERLVMVKTYEVKATWSQIHTEAELYVLRAKRAMHLGLDCWRLTVSDGGVPVDIFCLDEYQMPDWVEEVDEAKKQGRSNRDWDYFFALSEGFAKVRPGWATTVHKSQGSTYPIVFVMQSDVLKAPNKSDPLFRNRLVYVAYSRARDGLFLA